jgi:hypothetical protein
MGDKLKIGLVIASTLIGAYGSIVQVIDFVSTGKLNALLISLGFLFLAPPLIAFVILTVNAIGSTPSWNPVNTTIAVTAFLSLIGVVALLFVVIKAPAPMDPPPPPPAPTTTSPTSPPAAPVATITFASPAGQTVQPARDLAASGTVQGLQGDTLWIVTRPDHGDGKYYLTKDGPVVDQDGPWNFVDEAVGDNSDRGASITYIGIQANAACSTKLAATPPDPNADGNRAFAIIPSECKALQPRAVLHIAGR